MVQETLRMFRSAASTEQQTRIFSSPQTLCNAINSNWTSRSIGRSIDRARIVNSYYFVFWIAKWIIEWPIQETHKHVLQQPQIANPAFFIQVYFEVPNLNFPLEKIDKRFRLNSKESASTSINTQYSYAPYSINPTQLSFGTKSCCQNTAIL